MAFAETHASILLTSNFSPVSIRQVTIAAPAAGHVVVNVSGWMEMSSTASVDAAVCSIGTTSEVQEPYAVVAEERAAGDYFTLPFGGTRTFAVAPGSITFRFVCRGTRTRIADTSMSAIIAGSPWEHRTRGHRL